MNEQSKKEMAEALWMEINRAIINSNRVRDCLISMKEKDILDYLCEHDFLLDGEKLIEEILDVPSTVDEPGRNPGDAFMMFLGKQGQSLSAVENTTLPKAFFTVN
ncbi:MAG: hypothetical protein OEM27_07320 [Nitrospinota bacterium]|nr:hypothetical protein [Nitrospinota bacterium]